MSSSYIPQIYKDFERAAMQLGRKHSLSRVFNDLLTMAVCSFHETNIMTGCRQKDEPNEEIYFQAIDGYEKEELSEFAKMVGMIQFNALQAPYSDLLGQFFTEHITRGHNGQFFTPDSVCQMIAGIHGEPGTDQGKTIADPACGSGRLILTFAKSNPDNTFYAADNNATCAKMSAVNFFINGVKGEVAWMNTLSMEWYGGWHTNRWPRIGIVPIEKEQSSLWAEPVLVEKPLKSSDKKAPPGGHQLALF